MKNKKSNVKANLLKFLMFVQAVAFAIYGVCKAIFGIYELVLKYIF